jgi:hypothetical protein
MNDDAFRSRLDSEFASRVLLANLRMYFECVGFLNHESEDGLPPDVPTLLKRFDLLDDCLQLVMVQAKAESTMLARLIYEGFCNPSVQAMADVLSRKGENPGVIRAVGQSVVPPGFQLQGTYLERS